MSSVPTSREVYALRPWCSMYTRILQALCSAPLRPLVLPLANSSVISKTGCPANSTRSLSSLPRQFVTARPSPPVEVTGPSVTVVTYNLLAQKYIDAGKHDYCAPMFRSWQSRWPRMAAELTEYDADILCLQEVEQPVFHDHLVPLLASRGMQGSHRPKGDRNAPPEGVALFHRTTEFDCLKTHIFGFGDSAPSARGFYKHVRARQEGAILTLLRHKQTGKVILAGSVHLYFHPEWPDIKLAQAALLCSEAVKLIKAEGKSPSKVPLILGGDWNSLWRKYRPDKFDQQIPDKEFISRGVYDLFERGRIDKSHHDHPATRHNFQGMASHKFTTTGLQLQSAYAAGNEQQEPPLTTQTATFNGCLDYIWFSSGHWHVTHVLDMPYKVIEGREPQAEGFHAIPDANFPSDHLAMGCRLVLQQ